VSGAVYWRTEGLRHWRTTDKHAPPKKNRLGIPQELILCIHLPSMVFRQVVRIKLGQIWVYFETTTDPGVEHPGRTCEEWLWRRKTLKSWNFLLECGGLPPLCGRNSGSAGGDWGAQCVSVCGPWTRLPGVVEKREQAARTPKPSAPWELSSLECGRLAAAFGVA